MIIAFDKVVKSVTCFLVLEQSFEFDLKIRHFWRFEDFYSPNSLNESTVPKTANDKWVKERCF